MICRIFCWSWWCLILQNLRMWHCHYHLEWHTMKNVSNTWSLLIILHRPIKQHKQASLPLDKLHRQLNQTKTLCITKWNHVKGGSVSPSFMYSNWWIKQGTIYFHLLAFIERERRGKVCSDIQWLENNTAKVSCCVFFPLDHCQARVA